MPLASFAFTGCVAGHMTPSGLTHASTVVPTVAGSGSRISGFGGKGNGCAVHARSLARDRSSSTRQIAYATPATMPAPRNRFSHRRMRAWWHTKTARQGEETVKCLAVHADT